MKIRLGILDKDQNYLNRIISVMGARYIDNLELYAFTNIDNALATIDQMRIDVFLCGDFDVEPSRIPARCGFAYLVESADMETVNGVAAINRFQKVDLIYKHVLSIYSDHMGRISSLKFGDVSSKLIAFQPVSGGSGSSTLAAACAMHFAAGGKKVLYLNLEKFGSADVYFTANGQFDMSDVIYALKSRKSNLSLKLESSVRSDSSGVCFYSRAKLALDMLELNVEETGRLIDELKASGIYEYIIVDMDFSIDRSMFEMYGRFHSLVWVGDGTVTSNVKLARAYEALSTIDPGLSEPLMSRVQVAYNRFSKSSSRVSDVGLKSIGGSPKIDGADIAQMLRHISSLDMFDRIL